MNALIIVMSALMAVLTFFFVILIFTFFRRRQSLDIFHRLRRHYDKNADKNFKSEDALRRGYKYIRRVAEPLAALNFVKQLEFKLKQAGIPLTGGEFIVIVTLLTIFGALFAYMVSLNINLLLLMLVGMPAIAWTWVRIKIDRRKKAFTEQLGDCLTTVANALRAGYSFQQAMDVVAQEMEPPMSTEFARVTADVAMGVSLETALDQMNHRIKSSDFELVVTAVLIQREVGGNLAQILDTISETINERIRMKREINALTAQGRFSAWVLLILPFIVAAFCYVFNHDQFMMLFEEESGRMALIAAIVLEILGFFVIQKIVDIEL
ncbi:MAG: type II secretion system F family protein [Selenomonadaceae bacterium]|nr:type II secretion system F family protein [Selenomonadaceae bacterium]